MQKACCWALVIPLVTVSIHSETDYEGVSRISSETAMGLGITDHGRSRFRRLVSKIWLFL